jgi:hypothetical protein
MWHPHSSPPVSAEGAMLSARLVRAHSRRSAAQHGPRAHAAAAARFQHAPRPQRAVQVRAAAEVLDAPAAAAPAAAAKRLSKSGLSRRMLEQLAKVPGKEVSLAPLDAIRLVLSTATTKFTETVEASRPAPLLPLQPLRPLRPLRPLPLPLPLLLLA